MVDGDDGSIARVVTSVTLLSACQLPPSSVLRKKGSAASVERGGRHRINRQATNRGDGAGKFGADLIPAGAEHNLLMPGIVTIRANTAPAHFPICKQVCSPVVGISMHSG